MRGNAPSSRESRLGRSCCARGGGPTPQALRATGLSEGASAAHLTTAADSDNACPPLSFATLRLRCMFGASLTSGAPLGILLGAPQQEPEGCDGAHQDDPLEGCPITGAGCSACAREPQRQVWGADPSGPRGIAARTWAVSPCLPVLLALSCRGFLGKSIRMGSDC